MLWGAFIFMFKNFSHSFALCTYSCLVLVLAWNRVLVPSECGFVFSFKLSIIKS